MARRVLPGERERRHAEVRDTQRGAYAAARMNYPGEREFGAAEFVDDEGRQYRLAYAHKLGGWPPGTVVPPRPPDARVIEGPGGRCRLWLKVPRGRPWRERARLWFGTGTGADTRVRLHPVTADSATRLPLDVRVAEVEHERARRTGAVMVQGAVDADADAGADAG